jgi:hypothetical protein
MSWGNKVHRGWWTGSYLAAKCFVYEDQGPSWKSSYPKPNLDNVFILITVQDIYYSHSSIPKFSTFLQNSMFLVVHEFKSPNCQQQWYCFFYNWSILRCDTKSSLKYLCTFTVSRVLWLIIEASLFNIIYSQMLW